MGMGMHELLRGATGTRMDRESYRTDLRKREWAVDGVDSWKLERGQHFREPWNDRWVAFDRGDWDEALRMNDAARDAFTAESRKAAEHGLRLLRVRVVEEPITPYLRWELHSLRVHTECGELIRVVGPEQVKQFEDGGLLPELLTIGPDTVYEIVYDETGLADGAIRYVDAGLRTRIAAFIEELYDVGEDIQDFVQRKIAHLEPPTAT